MQYSIILSIDCYNRMSIQDLRPHTHLLTTTESDGEGDYDDIFGKNHKHRKLTGVIPQAVFDRIVDHCCLTMDSCDTMGMIGAPHLDGCGWSPAFSFSNNDQDSIISMYVCPFPSNKKDEKKYACRDEVTWNKLKEDMLKKYS